MAKKKQSLPDQVFSDPGTAGAAWQNRIVRYDPAARVADLVPHELNFRVHNGFQTAAMRGILAQVGIVAPVKVSQRTGKLLNGHLRVKIMQELGIETVPASYVDVDEEEEARIIATLDPLARFARANLDATEALIGRIDPTNSDVAGLLIHIAGEANVPVPEAIARRYVDLAASEADMVGNASVAPDAEEDEEVDAEEDGVSTSAPGAKAEARESRKADGASSGQSSPTDFAPEAKSPSGTTEVSVRAAAQKALDKGTVSPLLIGTKVFQATETEVDMFKDIVKYHVSQTGLLVGLAAYLLSFHFDLDAIDEEGGAT